MTTAKTKKANTAAEIRELSAAEVGHAAGGADNTGNWHHCPNGTAAGGGPGLYPWYVKCK